MQEVLELNGGLSRLGLHGVVTLALIGTDEGASFFDNIMAKQTVHENEKAHLNKLWSGGADYTKLANTKRGFEKSNTSLSISIQPEPLINLIVKIGSTNDGFIDRLNSYFTLLIVVLDNSLEIISDSSDNNSAEIRPSNTSLSQVPRGEMI